MSFVHCFLNRGKFHAQYAAGIEMIQEKERRLCA